MRSLSAALLVLALAGCATTGEGDNSLAIDTATRGQPVAGVNCNVSTATTSWRVTPPVVLPLGNSNGDLRIVCDKPGYRTSEYVFSPVPGRASSGSSLGIGLGGGGRHVGLGVGVNVPLQIGGGARAEYPAKVTIDMNPL